MNRKYRGTLRIAMVLAVVALSCARPQPTPMPAPSVPTWMSDYPRPPANVVVRNTCPTGATVIFVDPEAGAVLAARYLDSGEETPVALLPARGVELHVRLHDARNSVYRHTGVRPSMPPARVELSGRGCEPPQPTER